MRQSSSSRQRQIISFLIFVSIILFISIFAIVSTSQRRDANINNDTGDDDGTIVVTTPGINNGTMMIRGTLRPSVAPTTTTATLAPSANQELMTIVIVSDGSGNMTIVENPTEEEGEPQPQLEPADFYTPTDETTKAPVPAATTTTNGETGEASSHPSSYSLPTVSPTADVVYLTSTSPSTDSPSRRPSNVPTDYPTRHPTNEPIPTQEPSNVPTDYPTRRPTNKPTDYPSSDYAPTLKPTFIPTQEPTLPSSSSSPLAMSPFAYDNVDGSVASCTSSQIHLRIELVTDNYPRDTSWQFIDRTDNVILLSSPADGYSGTDLGNGRMESQSDTRDICLGGDDDGGSGSSSTSRTATATTGPTKREYEFIIRDIYGDGLCCRPDVASGYYKIYRKREDGNKKWQLLVAGSEFDTKVVAHHFVMHHAVGVRNPNLPPSSSSQTTGELVQAGLALPSTTVVMTSLALTCPPPRRKITVQIKTDKNGGDISWDFRTKDGPIIAKNEKKYQSYELDERDICVDDSALYELSVYDDDMDGMHAFNRAKGPNGHYKILAHRDGGGGGMYADLMRETILYGGYFKSNNITHLINTTVPTMTARDASWLDSHNKRRKYWHPYYNTTYVPLQWSESLKAEAQVWANKLLDACGDGMYHDPERDYGENAAANVGAGSWGELRVPDKIVARFIDNEVDLPWPHNGHLTQAVSY